MNNVVWLTRLNEIVTFLATARQSQCADSAALALHAWCEDFPPGVTSDYPYRADMQYAVVAWIDDVLMNHDWPGQDAWFSVSLQQQYYHENIAGERFYTKLAALKAHGHRARDALLLYTLCLELGFIGKYRLTTPETALQIATDCADFLDPLLPSGAVSTSPKTPTSTGSRLSTIGWSVFMTVSSWLITQTVFQQQLLHAAQH